MSFNSYVSEAKSKKEIKAIANAFRKLLGITNTTYVEVVKYLDILAMADKSFDYEVVDDSKMEKNKQAEIDVVNRAICIKQSVFDGACAGNKVDRMTIAHEIGHYVLVCLCGIKFARNLDKHGYVETFRDPEWQATVFASEFMMPVHMIKGMSPNKISEKFGVTLSAARSQLRHI